MTLRAVLRAVRALRRQWLTTSSTCAQAARSGPATTYTQLSLQALRLKAKASFPKAQAVAEIEVEPGDALDAGPERHGVSRSTARLGAQPAGCTLPSAPGPSSRRHRAGVTPGHRGSANQMLLQFPHGKRKATSPFSLTALRNTLPVCFESLDGRYC